MIKNDEIRYRKVEEAGSNKYSCPLITACYGLLILKRSIINAMHNLDFIRAKVVIEIVFKVVVIVVSGCGRRRERRTGGRGGDLRANKRN